MLNYVTHDAFGNVTGAYKQNLQPEHVERHVEATPAQMGAWHSLYVANGALVPLLETEPPAFDPITQRVQAIAPELTALGHWEQRWEVVELFDTQTEKDEAIAADRAAKQAAAWERIKVHRDYLSENGGYKVSVGGVDKWFHSDAKSKTQQLSLVLLGANASAVPPWKTMDGSKVVMSQTLAGQIFAAAVTQDGTLFAAAEAHRVAMEASNTPESYDFSGGWPAIFEE